MAIESTTSPLASPAVPADGDMAAEALENPLADEDREEEVEERKKAPKPDTGSLLANLLLQIDDINLARYMDQADLDQIGAEVVEQYRIDENSRADWLQKAEKALRFAMQETKPKQFPWPNASSFIYPLISQAALEFAARTYPAMIQGRNIVKGVVWGSDDGTPVTKDGQPDGEPIQQDSIAGPPAPAWLVPPGS